MTKRKISVAEIVETLGLEQSPTGGSWYKQVHNLTADDCEVCTSRRGPVKSATFMYLLEQSTRHEWHMFNSALIWNHIDGATTDLSTCDEDFNFHSHLLGGDILEAKQPIVVVPAKNWQRIRTNGDWSLVSCTHASGFDFGQLKIAEAGWTPQAGQPVLRFPASNQN